MDPLQPPLLTRRVRVRGLVQGVGYRYACAELARSLGIAGWVRNRLDGSVEAVLQGHPDPVERMCERLRSCNPGARVEALEISEVPEPAPSFDGFEQRPTA
ncbi:acylphosphatase [Ramlibacter sp.]|uniref:acylphosphatase n=1 Tax=Ramlibacter sp. TaxID=1917967 RepID=UPI002D22DA98|nr:acylphosphatase [Ramlibacter sp.]HYD76552.1 acylphosphatase [Ramlibacter sp.]